MLQTKPKGYFVKKKKVGGVRVSYNCFVKDQIKKHRS